MDRGKDVTKKGKAYYEIDRTVLRENEKLGAGSHILYVNGAYTGDDEMGRLMHDLKCTDPHKIYNEKLRRPAFFKETPKGERKISRLGDEIRKDRIEDNKRETALRMIKIGKYTKDEIAEISGLSKSQVEKLEREKILS